MTETKKSFSENVEVLLRFLSKMSDRQFKVLQELQATDFNGPEPEKAARPIFDAAMRAGFENSSVIHGIVKYMLITKGISFDKKKLNDERWGAKQYWASLGRQQYPPPPPLIRDPNFPINPESS